MKIEMHWYCPNEACGHYGDVVRCDDEKQGFGQQLSNCPICESQLKPIEVDSEDGVEI